MIIFSSFLSCVVLCFQQKWITFLFYLLVIPSNCGKTCNKESTGLSYVLSVDSSSSFICYLFLCKKHARERENFTIYRSHLRWWIHSNRRGEWTWCNQTEPKRGWVKQKNISKLQTACLGIRFCYLFFLFYRSTIRINLTTIVLWVYWNFISFLCATFFVNQKIWDLCRLLLFQKV